MSDSLNEQITAINMRATAAKWDEINRRALASGNRKRQMAALRSMGLAATDTNLAFVLAKQQSNYDAQDRCVECRAHIAEPHAPTCSHTDATDDDIEADAAYASQRCLGCGEVLNTCTCWGDD